MKINILILEENKKKSEKLRFLLNKKGYESIQIVHTKEEAFDSISRQYPSIAILRTRTKVDNKAGIEMAQHFNLKNPIPVIFLSDFKEDLSLFLKVKPSAFLYETHYETIIHAFDIAVHKLIEVENTKVDFVFIPKNKVYYKVFKKDIYFVHADHGCINIHTKENKFLLSSTLSRFRKQICDTSFLSIHRSYLINFNQVSSFDADSIVINDTRIPMSRKGQNVLQNKIVKIRSK